MEIYGKLFETRELEDVMEENQLTNRIAIWIGVKMGLGVMLLAFILLLVLVLINGIDSILENVIIVATISIIMIGPGIPFGVAGALMGKYLRNTKRATEIGAMIGDFLGIVAWSLLYLSLFGIPISD